MAYTLLRLNGTQPLSIGTKKGKDALRAVANRLMATLGGSAKSDAWSIANSEAAGVASHAAAVCKMATSSGTVGVVINGVSLTVTWATSDTVSQGLLVTAINANGPTAALGIKATQRVGVLTLSTLAAASVLDICGTRLVAGTDFSIAGTDLQDAQALAVAINANPRLSAKLVAVPDASAGVCYICLLENRAARSDETLALISGSGLTVTAQIVAGAYSVVFSQTPGGIANGVTVTATGTAVTAHSAVTGKLGGGVNAAPTFLTSDAR